MKTISFEDYLKILGFLKKAKNSTRVFEENEEMLLQTKDYVFNYPQVIIENAEAQGVDQNRAWAFAAHIWNECCFVKDSDKKYVSIDGWAKVFCACCICYNSPDYLPEAPGKVQEIFEQQKYFVRECADCNAFCSKFILQGEPVALRRYAVFLQEKLEKLLNEAVFHEGAIANWVCYAEELGTFPSIQKFLQNLTDFELSHVNEVLTELYKAIYQQQIPKTKPVFDKLFRGIFVSLEADSVLFNSICHFNDFCTGLRLKANAVIKDPYFENFISPLMEPLINEVFSLSCEK